MDIKIIKRDGSLEEYSEGKIAKVVAAAGLAKEQVNVLTFAITKWVKDNSLSKFSSLKIRDRVAEELKKIDKNAHNLFVWYQKTKE